MKPGYPGADSTETETRNTIGWLCDLMKEVHRSHAPRRILPWEALCRFPEDGIRWDTLEGGSWPFMVYHWGHLVGLQLSGLGYHGALPRALFQLTMLIELDLSRNAITGENYHEQHVYL